MIRVLLGRLGFSFVSNVSTDRRLRQRSIDEINLGVLNISIIHHPKQVGTNSVNHHHDGRVCPRVPTSSYVGSFTVHLDNSRFKIDLLLLLPSPVLLVFLLLVLLLLPLELPLAAVRRGGRGDGGGVGGGGALRGLSTDASVTLGSTVEVTLTLKGQGHKQNITARRPIRRGS